VDALRAWSKRWTATRTLRDLVSLAGFGAAYVLAGWLGVRLAIPHTGVSPAWPAAGIGLAGLVLLGPAAWPVVLLGAVVVNLLQFGAGVPAVGIAVADTIEAALGAWLMLHWVGGTEAFGRPRRTFKFTVLAAGVGTIGATLGAMSLTLGHMAPWTDFGAVWVTHGLGHLSGMLVVAPATLLWTVHPEVGGTRRERLEAAGVVLSLVTAGLVAFSSLSPAAVRHDPLEVLCLPPLLWASFRLRPREAATAMLAVAAMAVWGTMNGLGPFGREASGQSVLPLQAFTCVAASVSLITAAVVSERRFVERRLRSLSVTDPLTGLANHRRLVAVLENEIMRSGRTEQPFALLFLDLDDLKVINDQYGHLVGSRALRRLGDILRATCRAVDTPARYGGDEFAVVLPETGEAAAQEVAQRVADGLARDTEQPRITASIGVAVHPRDGESAEALIGAADRILYLMKRTRLQPTR
jgi:diguanylate cyclase (GGDEF)-like protein